MNFDFIIPSIKKTKKLFKRCNKRARVTAANTPAVKGMGNNK